MPVSFFQASQQLQMVLGYESDYSQLKEWLEGQRSTMAGFSQPAVTAEAVRAQITEVEVTGL